MWRVEVDVGADLETSGSDHASAAHVDEVTVVLGAPPFAQLEPTDGTMSSAVEAGRAGFDITLRSTRWGRPT